MRRYVASTVRDDRSRSQQIWNNVSLVVGKQTSDDKPIPLGKHQRKGDHGIDGEGSRQEGNAKTVI